MAKDLILPDPIFEAINNHEYDNLKKFLDNTDWYSITPPFIILRDSIRKSVRIIEDEEVRLDVMMYLKKYANDYFFDGACLIAAGEGSYFSNKEIDSRAAEIIEDFRKELAFQIDLIESSGEFSGDKFRKLKKSNEELKKINAEQERKIKELSEIIDKYKHPSRHGKYIPKRLQNAKFDAIIKHLQSEEVLRVVTEPNEYGFRVVTCIHWDASKALFGYFVEKVNDALKLRGARVPLNWKIFEPAVFNYKDLVGEARKALSTYKNSSSLQPERINDVEKVDKAIEIALKIESDPNKDSV